MPDSIVAAIRNSVDPTAQRPRSAKGNPPLDRTVELIGSQPGSGVDYFTASVSSLSGPEAAVQTGPEPHKLTGDSVDARA
jgi:hypothetical protein